MWRASLVIALVASGCLPGSQKCATNADCGSLGVCEPVGFCSFVDPSCTDGRRFSDLAGSYSQTCVGDLPLPDAGIDTPGTNDSDGDGVVDTSDNCPALANGNQVNEDGDRFGDVCDPCPPVNDDNPVDADSDGVGDACDPNPATTGDRIALFEGFHTSLPTGWEMVGTWTAASGAATITQGATSAWLAVAATTRTRETVSTAFTLDAFTVTSAAGVIDNKAVGINSGVASVPYNAGGSGPGFGLYETTNPNGATIVAYDYTVGTTYKITQTRNGTMYRSTAVGTTTAILTKTVALTNAANQSGITATNGTFRFHWFMVVESP